MAFSRSHLLDRGFWDVYDYPPRILDQYFPTGLYDSNVYSPMRHNVVLLPRTRAAVESLGRSEVKSEKDKFQIMLNVGHFKPDEVEVKVVDNYIAVHGKHEERADEHGFIQREFRRRYMLPEGAKADSVKSSLKRNGVLTIEVLSKAELLPPNERVVPITFSHQDPPKEKE